MHQVYYMGIKEELKIVKYKAQIPQSIGQE